MIVEVVSVLSPLVTDYLPHLDEHWVVLLIESLLIEAEMLMVQDQTLVLLLNLKRQLLAELLNLSMELDHSL